MPFIILKHGPTVSSQFLGWGKLILLTKPVRLITCTSAIFRNNSSRFYRRLGAYNNIDTFEASPLLPITANLSLVFYSLGRINKNKQGRGVVPSPQTRRSSLASPNKEHEVPVCPRHGLCGCGWKELPRFPKLREAALGCRAAAVPREKQQQSPLIVHNPS